MAREEDDEPGGVVADNLKSSLDQYTPHATSALVEQLATPLDLWTGRSAPVFKAHALNGVLQGYLLFCHRRGSYAIWSTTFSLWFFVAQSLGFHIKVAWSGDPLFSTVMSSLFPRSQSLWETTRSAWCWGIVQR